MVAMENGLMIRKFKLRELETERLRLASLRETDADKFFALKSDSIVTLPSHRLLERHGFYLVRVSKLVFDQLYKGIHDRLEVFAGLF